MCPFNRIASHIKQQLADLGELRPNPHLHLRFQLISIITDRTIKKIENLNNAISHLDLIDIWYIERTPSN